MVLKLQLIVLPGIVFPLPPPKEEDIPWEILLLLSSDATDYST